ncbi:MAG: NAD(P)/FAD-dependent oxidoreductase [Acidimicrobiales bacterium]
MTLDVTASPSPFLHGVVPITETDDEIRDALAAAELPPLLPALAYLTGDLSLLRPHLQPDPLMMSMPQGGLTDDQQAEIRAIALDVLCRYRDGGCRPAPVPSDDQLCQILEFIVGGAPMGDYLPLVEEELAYRGEDRRAPDWRLDELAPGREFHVVIIGAGMSGILAAHRLQQAGVPFTILDKNDDVGGTWHESVYPGCRVDNPNHNYSYSFAQKHDWPFHYSPQGVLEQYFRDCADTFGIRPHVRFGCTVQRSVWDDEAKRWTVHYTEGGVERTITGHAVISAVGQLNRPLWPTIDGIAHFEGPYFHSAEWRHDLDLTGKKVAVIGTGASALQFIPEVARVAGHVTVFQRTPPWIAPTPDYHDEIAPGLKWLYGHVPTYSELNRFAIFWRMGDGAIEGVRVDPNWQGDGSSVSEISEFGKQMLLEYYREQFGDRPDLLEAVTPHYPVGAKRAVRDNGIWATTLKRPNVVLRTDAIAQVDATGVAMADGSHVDADVIIYGTGYQASKFLTPMQVLGVGARDLHEQWAGDARAYLGVSIPGFPNFWCLYGPNTNIVINGSIIYFSECGVRFILGLVREVLANDAAAIMVRQDVHDAFNEAVDAENRRMAWGWSPVNSWYKNQFGRVAQNWPFTLLEYWRRTKDVQVDEFDLIR